MMLMILLSKNLLQLEFIDRYKKSHPWIFMGNNNSQVLSLNYISTLRETKINVNIVNL